MEFLLGQEQQVFMISWRTPTARHADWNLDTYIHGAMEAMDAAREMAGTKRVAVQGTCSGGIIGSMAAAHLAGTGRSEELGSLTLAVTVLDQTRAGTAQALVDHRRAARTPGHHLRPARCRGHAGGLPSQKNARPGAHRGQRPR